MGDIFDNSIAMDCFCYDIIEAWIAWRKRNNKSYDEDSYIEWLQDDFMRSMELLYEDCLEDEEDEMS